MHVNPQRVQVEEPGSSLRLITKPRPSTLAPLALRFLHLLWKAIWRAFQHDAFAIAKASAYSSILTFFPALLVIGSVLGNGSNTRRLYSREISYALERILPAGISTVQAYLRGNAGRSVGLLVTSTLLTVWLGSGVMVSWMEGFRRCYELPKIWGLVKERIVAFSLVILAGIPLVFSTILVAFGSEIETTVLLNINHEIGYYVLLMWKIVRWVIAILTSVAVIALIYHNAVPRTQPWHSVLPGATLAFRLVLAELCRLQRDLWFAGRGHCAVGVDVFDLARDLDRRGVQCHVISEIDAGQRANKRGEFEVSGGGNCLQSSFARPLRSRINDQQALPASDDGFPLQYPHPLTIP